MRRFRHYSFDLWLTLIRSNPAYKPKRAAIFCSKYNLLNKTLEDISEIFRQVDLMCNAINETTGKNIDAEEMYLMVLTLINEDPDYTRQVDTGKLYADMESLVFANPPLIYADETIDVLQHLKEKGNTLSILSNTGFIKGSLLRRVLAGLKIDHYFDFQLYSDEAGLSKPNPEFFELMIAAAKSVNQPDGISFKEIIHIGDNPFTDIKGAERSGINTLLVNSNNYSITNLIS